MLQADSRHFGDANELAGKHATVAGDYPQLSIDEDRNIKTKTLDAIGELAELLVAMKSGVLGIKPK
jgi:hypothetical protein